MDLSALCRSCMKELSSSESELLNEIAFVMFCYCMDIKLSKDDRLPKQFCSDCLSQIDLSYKFIMQAQKVNIALNNILVCIDTSNPIETEKIHCNIKKENDIDSIKKYDSDNFCNEAIENHVTDVRTEICTEIDLEASNIIKTENVIAEELAITYDLKTVANNQGRTRKKKNGKGKEEYSKTSQTLGSYQAKKENCCCPICRKTFKSKVWLTNHLSKAHNNMKTMYLCKECPETFSKKSDLKSHSTIHQASSLSTLKSHSTMRGHEASPSTQQVSCPECGEQCPSHRQLAAHAQTHSNATGSRPYICDYCLLRFKNKYHLGVHITNVHMSVKPHLCYVCGISFSQLGNLKAHMATHSSAKPFGCEQCTFVTNSPYLLRRHRRRHDPAKYYTHRCTQCAKAFSNSFGLNRHMRRHTGARPYKCTHCDLGFIDSWKRKVHIMATHKMLLSELQRLPMDPGAVSTQHR